MIRLATISDVPSIRAVAQATWPIAYNNIISPEQIAYMLEWMYNEQSLTAAIQATNQEFLVAVTDQQLIGFAGIEHHYMLQPITRIHKLYVLPSVQGSGIGKQLLNAVAERALKHQSNQLHLNVNKENNAVLFYKKHGFEINESVELEIGNGFIMDDFIMTKTV